MARVMRIRIGSRGRLTIPRRVRRKMNLEDGDLVDVRIANGRIIITPLSSLLADFGELTRNIRNAEADVVQELLDERKVDAATSSGRD